MPYVFTGWKPAPHQSPGFFNRLLSNLLHEQGRFSEADSLHVKETCCTTSTNHDTRITKSLFAQQGGEGFGAAFRPLSGVMFLHDANRSIGVDRIECYVSRRAGRVREILYDG